MKTKKRIFALVIALAAAFSVFGLLQAVSTADENHPAASQVGLNPAPEPEVSGPQYFDYYSNLHPSSVYLP